MMDDNELIEGALEPLFPPALFVSFRITAAGSHITDGGQRALRVTLVATEVPGQEAFVGNTITQSLMLEGKGAVFARPFFAAVGVPIDATGKFSLRRGDLIGRELVADVVHENWQGASWARARNFRAKDAPDEELTIGTETTEA